MCSLAVSGVDRVITEFHYLLVCSLLSFLFLCFSFVHCLFSILVVMAFVFFVFLPHLSAVHKLFAFYSDAYSVLLNISMLYFA